MVQNITPPTRECSLIAVWLAAKVHAPSPSAGLSIRKWVGGELEIVGGDLWAPKARCCMLGGSRGGKFFKFVTIMKHSEGLCHSDLSLSHAWNLPLFLAHSCWRFCLFDLSCIILKWQQVNDNLRHNIDINNDYSQVNPEGGRWCGL